MNKKILWSILGLLALSGAGYYYLASQAPSSQGTPSAKGGRSGMNFTGRPAPVVVAAARKGDIDVSINALGTVTALNTATIKPRVDGQLVRIAFQEGQLVKAGEVLAEIDARPYQAQLDQASGQLQRDQALLTNAQIDLERYRGLLAKDSIAKQQVDAQDALVRQYQGTVLSDKGQVENARLQLSFTKVTAPIPGRTGLKQVDLGNMVRASDATGIVVITQTQPITVVFSIPSESLPPVASRWLAKETLPVEAWDREGKKVLAKGKLTTLDNQIDTATGTVKLKAEFANSDRALFPNQFVNARLRVETRKDATLIPMAAIQRGTQGTFVYVVSAEDNTVSLRPVTLGPNTADTVAIEKGLEPGEQVVTDGADKLRQGAKVELASAEDRGPGKKGSRGGKPEDAPKAKGTPAAKTESAPASSPEPAKTPEDKPAATAPAPSAATGEYLAWLDRLPPEVAERLKKAPPEIAEKLMKMSPEDRRAWLQKRREERARQGGE